MTTAVAKPTDLKKPQPTQPQPLATISKTLREGIAAIEGIAKSYSLSAISVGQFERAFVVAEGIAALRKAFTPEVMAHIMSLQSCRLGFKTDKDQPPKGGPPKDWAPGYPEVVVKDVMVEMILRGFLPVGNEINIIAGNGYGTKEGFERLVGELPGVTDVRHYPGVPMVNSAGTTAVVDYTITCRQDGQLVKLVRNRTEEQDSRIPVKFFENQGVDAIVGKARRKALKFLYDHLTQSRLTVPDGDIDEVPSRSTLPSGATATDSLAAKLGERAKALNGGEQPLAEGELSAEELAKINEQDSTLPGMGSGTK